MKFLSFGEIMLRLKPPYHERLFQGLMLEATFGGGEANVAVSLANFGMDSAYITVLPANPIGDGCVQELRKFGVDTNRIQRGPGRMGIYFIEPGANQLPSKVTYDREYSAIALSKPGDIDWDKTFEGIDWFHTTGITPAISESAMQLTLESVKEANAKGITVSCDLNYRGNLWKYGKNPAEVMVEIVKYVDIVIAGREDCQKMLGVNVDTSDENGNLAISKFEKLSDLVLEQYPNLKMIAISLRQGESADINSIAGCINDRKNFYLSRKYHVKDIVDRVGSGDAFASGVIYGLNTYNNLQDTLEFAVASDCLKHSIIGDFNRVSIEDVNTLIGGNSAGRVQR